MSGKTLRAAFRPTNKPWVCPQCGVRLIALQSILDHKKHGCDPEKMRAPRTNYINPYASMGVGRRLLGESS